MARGIASLVQRRPEEKAPGAERSSDPSFWRPLVTWLCHIGGAAAGGAGLIIALWLLLAPVRTLPPPEVPTIAAILLAAWMAAIDLNLVARPPMLNSHRQVPIKWSVQHGFPGAFALYGVVLGSYVFTYVPFAVVYAVLAVGALHFSFIVAAGAGAAMGMGRAIPVGAAFSRGCVERTDRYLAISSRRVPALSAGLGFLLAFLLFQANLLS